jgi:hypothetical protein
MIQLANIVKRYSYVATAAVLALGMLMPVILSGSAGAAELSSRSVQLETATAGAPSIEYTFTFTASSDTAIQGIVIDFCADDGSTSGGPIPGANCVIPASMLRGTTITSLTIGAGAEDASAWTAGAQGGTAIRLNRTAAAATVAENDEFVVTIDGFTNPNLSQPNNTAYARIFTYDTTDNATAYTSTNPAVEAAPIDNGSVAFAIVPEINVSAIVRETLTFCVGGGQTALSTASSIYDNCSGNADGGNDGIGSSITSPSISLGATVGGIKVLDNQLVYTGDIFYQLTTNAATGAVLNIKGASADLVSGGNTIPAFGTNAVMPAGTAAFGMNVNTPGTPSSGATATVDGDYPTSTASTQYAFIKAAIESTYGDTFATVGGPTRNANGRLVFGATASADTQAGIYSGKYSLIATPKY